MTQITEPTYLYVQPPKRHRKVPKWLWAVVAMTLVAGAGVGTFASFTASTTNSSTFSTGALVLTNSVNSATACLSSSGGVDTNANGACDAAFNLATKKPGDSGTATIDVKNDGTVAGAHLKVYAGSACSAANAGTYNGTGDPCTKVLFYIQEWSSSNHTGASTCLYGGAAVANTCDFSDTSKTLTDFSSTYTTFSNGIDLSSLSASTTRYFTVGVKLDSAAGNNMQGRSAVMPLVWYLQQ